jgi:hypothetical protein
MGNGLEHESYFFFWIILEDKLDEMFYATSAILAEQGIKLLPIKIDQVSRLSALTNSSHVTVICSTRHAVQYNNFKKHVVPVLPMLLRQEKLTFFHFSSFNKLDVVSRFKRSNYYFLKYPLNLESICVKLKRFHELRLNRSQAWPGGRRAKVPGLAV